MKIAIFGTGGIAQRVYLPILTSWPGVEITGIFSRTQENVDKTCRDWHVSFGTTNFDQLLETKPEAALVITNSSTHFPLVSQLLKAGVDVLVEKPMAYSSDQVRQLADLADLKNRILMVSFNRRYAILYQQARQLFKDRNIQMAIFEKHRNSASHFSLYNNYVDDTIHQIDLVRYFCGEVVPAFTQTQMQDGLMIGAVSLATTSAGGLVVLNTSLKAGSWQERVTLHGDNFTVEVDAFRQLKIKKPDSEEIFGNERPGKWISELKERGFYGMVEHFLDCLKTRQQPLTSGRDALKTHELIDALVRMGGETPAKESESWDNVNRWTNRKTPYFNS
jgi:virulence factor